tara:strand:+ start:4259 stop:4825 length:567 start_codon:yes stop_codon:yes gene_type:complete
MSRQETQDRWDAIYSEHRTVGEPDPFVTASEFLPLPPARAVDLAGGTGGTALWLAANGYEVSLVEISQTAIEVAKREAARQQLKLSTIHHDLESSAQLDDHWDIAVCCNFLDRSLYSILHNYVTPKGVLFVKVATVTNLERHEKPSRRYLVETGELPDLIPGFEPLSYVEDWFDDRHEARMVCRRIVD